MRPRELGDVIKNPEWILSPHNMASKPVRVWSADVDDMGEKGQRGLD